tara:strand:+ start:1307 stop:2152 length:846 start_codon:yes stop_codon:yes gene_type:complete
MTYRTFDGTSQTESVTLGRFSSSGSNAISDGSTTQGAIYFADDKNTGIYSSAADTIEILAGGRGKIKTTATDVELYSYSSGLGNYKKLSTSNARVVIHRADSSGEGGELGLTRAEDDTMVYSIDVNGAGTSDATTLRIIDNVAGAARFSIAANGTLTASASNDISDQRLKKNIATISNPTDKIKALKGRTFQWEDKAKMQTGTKYGFVAQEVESVIPEIVINDTGIRMFNDNDELVTDTAQMTNYAKSVTTSGVVPVLVEALKEALTEIDSLKARVTTLEG